MLGSLRKKLEEVTAQVNPFDGGKTASTVRAARPPVAPAQTKPASRPIDAVSRGATSVLAGVGRFGGAGSAQLAGGAFDLLTPGKGTNRVSDWGNTKARELDVIARDHGNSPIYRGTQVASELLSMKAIPKAAASIASKAPAFTKPAVNAVQGWNNNVVPKVAQGAQNVLTKASMPTVGKAAGYGIRNGLTATDLAQDVAMTAKMTAQDASRGTQITPQRVATDAALTLVGNPLAAAGMGGVTRAASKLTTKLAPTVSQAVQGGKQLTTNLVKGAQNLDAAQGGFIVPGRTPKNIHPDDQAILTQFMDHARGIAKLDPDSAYRLELDAANIAERYGIDTPNTLGKFANAVDDRLMRERQAVAKPKRASLFSDEAGSIQVPGKKAERVYHGTTEAIDGDFRYPLYTTPKKDYAQVFADSSSASSIGKSGGKLNNGNMVHEFEVNPKARVLDATNPEHLAMLKRDYFGKHSMSYDHQPGKSGHFDWTEGENLAEFIEENKLPFDAIKLDEGGGGIDPSSGLPVIDKGVSFMALNKDALTPTAKKSLNSNQKGFISTDPNQSPILKAFKKLGGDEGGFARVPGKAERPVDDLKFDRDRYASELPAAKTDKQRRFLQDKISRLESDLEAAGFTPTTQKGSADRAASQPETPAQILKRQAEQPAPRTPKGTSQSELDSSLPVYNTTKVSNLDKVARSTQSIIKRQGKKGEELSGLLDTARDSKEIYLSELQQKMPTVSKLARKGKNAITNKDFENFVEAAQGKAKPVNDKVAQAVKEWQATHPEIRNRAVAAGLDVGDLGPNYYPHVIDYDRLFKDKNMYNQSINHLVETGQAKTPEEAIKLLGHAKDISRNREFGNLEASRLIDLPFYDKTPNSLISYLNGSAKRISQVETLGAGDEKALKLIADAGVEGYDTEAMKNAFDVAAGAKMYNPTASKVSGGIRKYVTTTRLGLGAITNLSQSVNTGIVTGHTRTLGSMVKQLDPKARQFVADTGVISDALLNDLKTQQGYSSFTSKVLGKGINKITAPFFGTVEKFNRSVAATAGRDYALRLAQKGDEATLRKLGVTGKITKELTEAQQVQAARKIVEKTQFKVDPQDLPGWTDSPGGKLVSQFRTFSYNQSKFFSNEILKPAAKGNLLPLGRMMAAIPVGYGLYEVKRKIAGRPEEEDKKKEALAAFTNIGGAGLALDLYQSLNPLGSKYIPSDRRASMAMGAFGGPAVGVASQGIGALSELVQRKNTPKDESQLDGKLVVGKTDDSYTDATPISRFGLQQLPVVGTAIKNRLLPFKEQSNAEAGKSTSTKMTTDQQSKYNALPEKDKDDFALAIKEGRVSDGGEVTTAEDDVAGQAKNDVLRTKQKLPDNMSKESVKVLSTYSRLSEEGKEKFNEDRQKKYEYDLAKYEQDTLEGKISSVEKIKKDRELNKKKIALEYDEDTLELSELRKQEVYDIISADPDGKSKGDQLLAYFDKLLDANIITDHPYRDKYGNVDFDPESSGGYRKGGKGGKGSSKYDYTKDLFSSGGSSTTKSLRSILEKAMAGKS